MTKPISSKAVKNIINLIQNYRVYNELNNPKNHNMIF